MESTPPRRPPRRPRRWSKACTATLVRLAVVVTLTALTAWPEEHQDRWVWLVEEDAHFELDAETTERLLREDFSGMPMARGCGNGSGPLTPETRGRMDAYIREFDGYQVVTTRLRNASPDIPLTWMREWMERRRLSSRSSIATLFAD